MGVCRVRVRVRRAPWRDSAARARPRQEGASRNVEKVDAEQIVRVGPDLGRGQAGGMGQRAEAV